MAADKYKKTMWTPPNWKPEEWQIIWRKLWLLPIESIRRVAKKTSIKFTNPSIQENATKEELISILDEADKKILESSADDELASLGIDPNKFAGKNAIENLDRTLKEKGLV